ncbi:hypothetical protein GCE9029_00767 [Grimontia celer]|uniref:Lipoprotein n=1 Tax=Grimontia celer TaxID=1796497 RepID=A0A128EUP1_9GAMM|nr:hypothetical protein [Grimontia celer]CZF78319.1 hypothetical protein GCE9029_00767 [Grimontia celer]
MKKVKVLRVMLLSSVAMSVIGCAGTPKTAESLPIANGNGAVVIPISMENTNEAKKYPCRSISFEVKKVFRTPEELDKFEAREIYLFDKPNFGLITDLEPGEYMFDEFKCHANYRRVFNDGQSYIRKRASVYFEVEPNTVTVSSQTFVGESEYDATGSSSFSAHFEYVTKQDKEKALKALKAKGVPAGWSFNF